MGSLAVDVTYSLGPAVPLLDDDFYAGVATNGVEPASARFTILSEPSKDGAKVAFAVYRPDSWAVDLFVVDVGDPGSWRRIAADVGYLEVFAWSPDDHYILANSVRYEVATGTQHPLAYQVMEGVYMDLGTPSTTSLPSGNWLVDTDRSKIVALPILPNGEQDTGREAVYVTDLGWDIYWPAIAHNGNSVLFIREDVSHEDIYALADLQAIIAAEKLTGSAISSMAPTSAADPRLVAIRTNEGGVDNVAVLPLFSQDGALAVYTEDWNGYAWGLPFFEWMESGDFELMLSNSDGTGDDFRIAQPGSQFLSGVTPGGVRIIYGTGSEADFRLVMASLVIETSISGNDVSSQTMEVQTDGGPVEITLGDNAVQVPVAATEPVTASDASGTVVTLPPGQVIDYPSGEPQTITISTPVDPVTAPQLPLDAPVDAIPVVRQFGPAGTNFYPPIVITMSYTDAEVAGLNEATLWPYLYNAATDTFDIRVPEADIVERNTAGNYIRFRVDHFSIYGIGGSSAPPAGLPLGGAAAAALVAVLGLWSAQQMRRGGR